MVMRYSGLDLPPIIQRAICRVNDPSILQELNPNLRWALSVLLRRVSALNGKDIFWVKRENFAKLLDASEATVYRILGSLESAGLVQRVAQKRSVEGEFTVGELKLSEGLCELLGLTRETRDEKNLYSKRGLYRLSGVKDGLYSNQENTQFSSKKQSLADPLKNSIDKRKLPDDLAVLLEHGLTYPQVYKLMGVAGKHGKRLSDVVAVCKAQLQKLYRNDLFAYLRKLIGVEKDFAYVREREEISKKEKQSEQRDRDDLLQLHLECEGKWFAQGAETLFNAEPNGLLSVYRLTGSRWSCVGVAAGESAKSIWNRIKNGDFVEKPSPPMAMLL
jgi:hypothetical protein